MFLNPASKILIAVESAESSRKMIYEPQPPASLTIQGSTRKQMFFNHDFLLSSSALVQAKKPTATQLSASHRGNRRVTNINLRGNQYIES